MIARMIACWALLVLNLSLTASVFAQTGQPVSITGSLAEPVFKGKIYYRVQGNPQGPAVLLVHGLGDNASRMWEETARKLSKDYLVYSFDLPGFGRSDKANKLYSPDNYVKLIRFIKQNRIKKPFHLVGHSMGGAIALRYAARYPKDVQSLTLIDAAGILYRLAYTKYLAPIGLGAFTDKFTLNRQLTSSWAGRLLNTAEGLVRFDPEHLLNFAPLRQKVLGGNPATIAGLALVLDDFSGDPARIVAPTRIIWGENDHIAPLRTGQVLDKLIKDSRLYIIKNAAHNPVLEAADPTFKLLLEGLQNPAQRSPATQNSNTGTTRRAQVQCRKQRDLRYSGKIGVLRLNGCKNIRIENAEIGKLIVSASSLHILNTNIQDQDVALQASNSEISITASRLEAAVAIQLTSSRLDIAGSELIAKRAAITSTDKVNVVFSLSQSRVQNQRRALHGRIEVSPRQALK